ncbi:hypothetical protein DACRYDRAFT_107364 [Dacryopinax primogenitus]|uniref:Uncharacterized protein n=1 Tax=Dacryopinax primogenitus (strain DJM 731) TaxID=1858805 RepID=M5G9A6_DACPD|nr:uncharacterized protein DACRYDRAFT_107364 [Dacryopinax primogenitus]EJU02447.1 hypothetical protein DACRYDRAFT_107364 [Dacryopinax primogenitus]
MVYRALASGIELPATNAERLRRGLPLKPPVQRTTAKNPKRSSIPPPPLNELYGFISISDESGPVGYLQCEAYCKMLPIIYSYEATSFRFTPNDLNGGGQPFPVTYDGGHLPNMGGHVSANVGELGPGSAAADPSGNLYLTGDVAEFQSLHGTGSSGALTFHFPAIFVNPPRARL